MTEVSRQSSTSEQRTGDTTRTVRHEETTIRDTTPVKAFKLRAGRKHYADGHAVTPGDEVHLSEDQARAFRDKFEPVDDAPFKVQAREAYRPRELRQQKQGDGSATGDTERHENETSAPQGAAPQAPPIPVGGGAAGEPLKDVTAIDPARQGQQSNELRQVIDSGNAPPPVVGDIPSLADQARSLGNDVKPPTPAGRTSGGSSSGAGPQGVPIAGAPTAGAGTPQSTSQTPPASAQPRQTAAPVATQQPSQQNNVPAAQPAQQPAAQPAAQPTQKTGTSDGPQQ